MGAFNIALALLTLYHLYTHWKKKTKQKKNIIVVFFSVAPIQNRTSECPLHYNLVGDDCYFVSSTKLTWNKAREVCKRESNGDLISVHSPVGQGEILTAQSKLYKKVAILREKNYFSWNSHAPEIRSSESFPYDYYDSVITIMSPLVESISDIIIITTTRRVYCVQANKNPDHS